MNNKINVPSTNKKILPNFADFEFSFKQTKKAFVIGAFLCLSSSGLSVFADSVQNNAKALISQPLSQYHQPTEINLLKEQLLEKNRELQEYKSGVFRASRPQDQAKIVELTQRIAEHEKAKQELLAKIKFFETELTDTKKQMSSMEVSTEALTNFIKSQRELAEKDKQELAGKIISYEVDTSLENEKRTNQKLVGDLALIKASIVSYETRISALEISHETEIQDALQDAAMLKFELADTKKIAENKERELIVTLLNHMTMSLDHAEQQKTKFVAQKNKHNETKESVFALKSTIDEITLDNLRLQRENDQIAEHDTKRQGFLGQHFAERHVLANKLLEKEEALSAALIYYNEIVGEHEREREQLSDHLSNEVAVKHSLKHEKEHLLSKHDVEKHVLENQFSDHSEETVHLLLTYQLMISDYLVEINQLQDRLAAEESHRISLEHELANHALEKHVLESTVAENQEIHASISDKHETYISQLQDLRNQLEKTAAECLRLQNERDHIAAELNLHKHVAESSIAEKEEALKAALISSQGSVTRYLDQIEALKIQLAEEEETRKQLQTLQNEFYTAHTDKASFEQSLKEKEEALAETLAVSQSAIAENQKRIEDLKEKLASEESINQLLKKAHEDSVSKHSETEFKLSQFEVEKLALEQTLLEKEEELSSALTASEASLKEYSTLIEDLKGRLMSQEADHYQLRQTHQDLASNYSEKDQMISKHEAEKILLEHLLEDKEHALNAALLSIETSTNEYKTIVESLKDKLSHQEAFNKNLEQSQNEFTANSSQHSSHRLQQEFDSLKEMNDLKQQVKNDNEAISYLKEEIAKLTRNLHEKTEKENELERAVHSLSVVAEQQDHALAEANSTFSMIQEYSYHLDAENKELKNRLHSLETAERTPRKEASKEEESRNIISPALLQLFRK